MDQVWRLIMPNSMRVVGNIKSLRNERVPTASIGDITYVGRQSFLRGETDIMRGELQAYSPLVQRVYWGHNEQDQIKRHFFPACSRRRSRRPACFLPCSTLAYKERLKRHGC